MFHAQPQRIQRRRSKGWRLPAETVCITRPGKWGNPFRVGGWFKWEPPAEKRLWSEALANGEPGFTHIVNKAQAVDWFARWLKGGQLDLSELRGKNLACWCKVGEPCHGDVLLDHANRPIAK